MLSMHGRCASYITTTYYLSQVDICPFSKVLEPDYAGFAGNDFVLGPNGHLSWRLPEQASRLVRLYTEETHSSIRLPNADVDHCSCCLLLPNTPITREPGRNCDTTAQLLSKPGNAAERAYFNADHAYGVNPELYGLCSTYETESLYFDVHAYPPTAKAQVTTSSFTPTSLQHANVPPAEMMPVIRHEVPGSSFSSNVYLENVQGMWLRFDYKHYISITSYLDSFIGAAPVVDPIIPNQHTQWEEQFILDNDVHMIADISEDANAESDFHMLYQTFMNHQVIEEKWIAWNEFLQWCLSLERCIYTLHTRMVLWK